ARACNSDFTYLYTLLLLYSFSFFFNDPSTTAIYTLSLHDALPIYAGSCADHFLNGCLLMILIPQRVCDPAAGGSNCRKAGSREGDRKSTRLNSSHRTISYAVFCLKKKKNDSVHGYQRAVDQPPQHA